jgi:hypothetical protein
MISHFSLTAFIRSVSRDLLSEYFRRAGLPLELGPRTPKKARAEPLIEAIGKLADSQRAQCESDFREVHKLATAGGIQRILDEANFQGAGLAAPLRERRGHLDKALLTYLNARAIFDAASLFAARDILPGRYWKRRLPLTGASDIDPVPKIAKLEQAISHYFRVEEGRGGACKIDYHGRRPLHHFFAYPEDIPPRRWSGRAQVLRASICGRHSRSFSLCADSKLIPAWYIGDRDSEAAMFFMDNLAKRLTHRVQLTSDGHAPYLEAVEGAFGADIDYAMLVKIYGPSAEGQRRYSPADCIGAVKRVVEGKPDKSKVSTSYVERNNGIIRQHCKRYARLTQAFSKKVENHVYAFALHTMYHNFVKISGAHRMTPAQAAGVDSRLWEIGDVVAMIEAWEANQAKEKSN